MKCFGNRRKQYAAASIMSIVTLTSGYAVAWPSTILEKLQAEDSPIGVISLEEKSWISSLLVLGMIAGNFFIGSLQDYFGRRGILLIIAVPIFICWLIILFAKSYIVLLITRFLIGAASVVPTMTSAVYISEISEPSIRGKLGMLNLFMFEGGMLLVTAIGSYSTYNAVAITGAVIPAVFYLLFFRMPESPYYYLRKGDVPNAVNSLSKLRMKDKECVKKELVVMQENVEKQMYNKGSLWEVLTAVNYRKALIIGLGTATLRQFSGTIAINSYMKTIFNQVENGLDPRVASVVCAGISMPSVFLGSHLIDKMGRKPLYCISVLGCSIALLIEFVYFFMQDYLKQDLTGYGIIPFFGLLIFNISKVLGIQTLPVILLSEIYPTNAKGWGIAVSMVYSSALAFIVSLCFPLVVELWGIYYCFLFFTIFCVLGLLFIIFVIPETKGQTLHAIQDKFESELNCDD